MNISDIKPAGQLSKNYGVKIIVYGRAGTAKTPSINSAPNPLLLSVEPGLKSMSGSTVPTFEAHTIERIDEFFKWFFGSAESKKFDTLAIDSGSQVAEIVLSDMLKRYKDGRKAYGETSIKVAGWFNDLFFMPSKHIILICKETKEEIGSNMVQVNGLVEVQKQTRLRPYFPGQDLNVKIPHQYDEIFHLDYRMIPGQGRQLALLTTGNDAVYARDRSGKLNELEPLNWDYIIKKCSS